jgi:hypothetical protein
VCKECKLTSDVEIGRLHPQLCITTLSQREFIIGVVILKGVSVMVVAWW